MHRESKGHAAAALLANHLFILSFHICVFPPVGLSFCLQTAELNALTLTNLATSAGKRLCLVFCRLNVTPHRSFPLACSCLQMLLGSNEILKDPSID